MIDATLAERCYCSGVISEITKSYTMELYPNPTKGFFYISIPEYSGQIIMTIKSDNDKLISTHYLMYLGLMTWRLTMGVYDVELKFENGQVVGRRVLVRWKGLHQHNPILAILGLYCENVTPKKWIKIFIFYQVPWLIFTVTAL